MTKKIIDELQPIFAPQSVAVIGASSAPFKWGTQTLHRLRTTGYEGALYPINPKEKEIMGMRAYPSETAPSQRKQDWRPGNRWTMYDSH